MQLEKGQLVFSRQGRDAGRVYAVLETAEDRALLANGGKWTKAQPKAKNIRHINPTKTFLAAGQLETDETLKRALAEYVQSISPETSGG